MKITLSIWLVLFVVIALAVLTAMAIAGLYAKKQYDNSVAANPILNLFGRS